MKVYKNKNVLLTIAAVASVGILLYLPGVKGLGYYRDAWNNFYNLTVRGPEMLIQAFEADRPADGHLVAALYRLFGTNIRPYLIYDLCCRILSSVFFSLTLMTIWPRFPRAAALAGVLAVVFPGFLQQVDAITYLAHQTAMLCFMCSLWLTVLSCVGTNRVRNYSLVFLSMVLSFVNVMLMEYYIGMEIYRFALIYMVKREKFSRKNIKDVLSLFWKTALSYIPYLFPVAGFVIWRVFFFNATRNGTNVMSEIVYPFITHPLRETSDFAVRFAKSVWKLFVGVWSVPVHNVINNLSMENFVKSLISAFVIVLAGAILMYFVDNEKSNSDGRKDGTETVQWLCFGLICGTISIFPLVISGRDINFSSSLDRFAWPGMIGAILTLIGLIGSLRNSLLRNVFFVAVLLVSVFVQWQNQANYIEIWNNTRDYWQQLIWRAPSIKPETTIVTGAAILAEEDYEIFSPASMIYYPYVDSWAPVSAEILSENTVRDIRMGKKIVRRVRQIYTEKDYKQLLAISKPGKNACLRVIDGNNPIYSVRDYTRIPEIGSYSRLEQIVTDPDEPGIIPFFLGTEQEHGWCYYYEKMELALQQNDPHTAAALADEAFEKKFAALDSVELVPVIEAYIKTGRTDDARFLLDELLSDDYMALMAENYFKTELDPEQYYDLFGSYASQTAETGDLNKSE